MNHVTAETARKLQEAGFPQPIATFGQIWHYRETEKHPWRQLVITQNQYLPPVCLFAPTATDILRELPGLSVYYSGLELWNTNNPFEGSFDCDFPPLNNPAEAAARFWLAVKEEGRLRRQQHEN